MYKYVDTQDMVMYIYDDNLAEETETPGVSGTRWWTTAASAADISPGTPVSPVQVSKDAIRDDNMDIKYVQAQLLTLDIRSCQSSI